ncbi:MAG: class I tRNA ligase family protein, partial [Clostridiales Family XIII bacterium]|nr:class I tRNA ligase family protein [Clostridiales Family XIII bacterium]
NLGEGGAKAVPALADLDPERLRDEDRWILDEVAFSAADITRNLESFDLSVATQKSYELIWNEYCDWYIEFVKPRLMGEDEADKEVARAVLIAALSDLLRLLHPFMPFITEEIWSFLGKDGKLIAGGWPAYGNAAGGLPAHGDAAGGLPTHGNAAGELSAHGDAADGLSAHGSAAGVPLTFADIHASEKEATAFESSFRKIEAVKEIVRAVRNIRVEAGAAPSRALPIVIKLDEEFGKENLSDGGGIAGLFTDAADGAALGGGMATLIGKLANVSDVTVTKKDSDVPADAMSSIQAGLAVYVAADDLLDYAAEKERLAKEKDRIEGNIARLRGKLSNEGFTAKAPENIVQTERDKLAAEEDAYEKVLARLGAIKDK